jgi:hypothetical protein
MGVQNIIDGDGAGLAITGMLIVFVGLILISLFIAALPRVLGWADAQVERRRRPLIQEKAVALSGIDDPIVRAAIGMVIEMEFAREESLDAQRITIERDEAQEVWTLAGKMRNLSRRM